MLGKSIKFLDEKYELIRLIFGLIFLFPTFWLFAYKIQSNIYIPDVFLNIWFQFSISTFILFLFSFYQIKKAISGLRIKMINSSLFIIIASFTAYFYSIYLLVNLAKSNVYYSTDLYFDAVIEINVIIMIGYYIESVFSKKTKSGLDKLNLFYEKETIILNGVTRTKVKIRDLKINDIVLVLPGKVIPSNGIIVKGSSDIDESSATGEVVPQFKSKGSKVLGGTYSTNSELTIKITDLPKDSVIGKVINGINLIQDSKPRAQRISDIIGKYFMPFLFLASLGGLLGWGLSGAMSWNESVELFITLLIVGCPMSFLLITPMVVLVSSTIASKKLMTFQSVRLFNNNKKVSTIIFDKTGTLTEGKPEVSKTTIEKKYFPIVKKSEEFSNHLFSQSIIKYFDEVDDSKIKLNKWTEIKGKGIHFFYKGKKYFLGSKKFILENTSVKIENMKKSKSWQIVLYFCEGNNFLGNIFLDDSLKKNVKKTISYLKKINIKTVLLTGDVKENAIMIKDKLGIDECHYELLPEDKSEYVREQHKKGEVIYFLGDGINDSIALKTADLGIAMGGGTEIAKISSDIIIRDGDISKITYLYKLLGRSRKTIIVGLFFAVIYNLTSISIGLAGLLNPVIGSFLMLGNDLMPLMLALTINLNKFDDKTYN